jgi:hypothetical protein
MDSAPGRASKSPMALIKSYLRASRTLFVSDQGKSGESVLSVVKPGGGVAAERVVDGFPGAASQAVLMLSPTSKLYYAVELKEMYTSKQNGDLISFEEFRLVPASRALTSVGP